MYSLLFLGIVSCLLSLVLTPIARHIFRRFGLVDEPNDSRKIHQQPIPRVGGIAIVLSYSLGFALLSVTNLKGGAIVLDALPFAWKLLPAAALMFITGLVDDIVRLNPLQKLTGQIASAALAYLSGIQIHALGGHRFDSWWSFPVTVFWLIACANALNLIDGLDGLAAGIGLFATATSLFAALIQHNVDLAFATLPLLGALVGFLRYNFNPATVFLGDSGSLFIGFMLGCYGVLWSHKSATMLGMAAPVIALSVPLLDTSLAIARRFLRRQPILSADRGHIHHRLLDRGLTPKKAALLLYGVCALSAILSLLIGNNHYEVATIAVFFALVSIGIRCLGYVEFETARQMFFKGSFRHLLSSHISLRSFESSLLLANTPDECWSVIRRTYKEFGFSHIQMQLAGRCYAERLDPPELFESWRLEISLSPWDYVHLAHENGSDLQDHIVVAPFAAVLRKSLQAKLTTFAPSKTTTASDIYSDSTPASCYVGSSGH